MKLLLEEVLFRGFCKNQHLKYIITLEVEIMIFFLRIKLQRARILMSS